ncbi:MAG: glycine dehydrogenase (aminomethyl-transferring) [Treponema sp. GWA1_62_8]|nr:MAG: glycine dehydrogenase (aminomethyl-transferring) [Treponema sp. GWA1_62_8]
MPYVPATDAQREDMLHRIGLVSIKELFEDFPAALRYPRLDLDEGLGELEVLRELEAMSSANVTADSCRWFLGAGAYDHFIPSAVPYLASRGEFVTAYTPYQPEVSQGTLQAIFEYQSMIADLTGMEAVNAGHYDGATALAEAVLMGLRGGADRRRVLLPDGLHPEYREVISSYLVSADVAVETYSGTPAAAAAASPDDLAVLVACYPDFFGRVADLSGAAEAVHAKGGILAVLADPVMLGLLKSPGEWGADVVAAEGQSLGNDLSYGGPYLGIMATTNALVRRLPGRIVGEARDAEGRRGFVLTLVAREQHIRREKAVSNICSNQGLATLRSCIHLALMGRSGMRRAAELCWHRAHWCARRIAALDGFSVAPGVFFKEFVVTTPIDAETLSERLCGRGIVCGLPLSRYWPERRRELLVCVTEKNSKADIEDLAEALREEAK